MPWKSTRSGAAVGLIIASACIDAVLIKDNHLAWLQAAARPGEPDPIAAAIAAARANTPRVRRSRSRLIRSSNSTERSACGPDIILVDNLGPELVAEAVRRRDCVAPDVQLEASGGVNLATVRALAETGVDRISVGALTHSAPALDLALDFEIRVSRTGWPSRRRAFASICLDRIGSTTVASTAPADNELEHRASGPSSRRRGRLRTAG